MSRLFLNDVAPNPGPGFETDFIQELESLIRTLPEGVARLSVGRVPGHPEWPEPYFEIIPNNSKAAPVKGTAIVTDLELTVGYSWREFYGFAKGGTILHGVSWREELRQMWSAIVAGQLKERLSFDSSGSLISWDSRLVLNDRDIVFRNGQHGSLFGHGQERVVTVTYEPYFET